MNFANELTFPEEATSVQGILVTCGMLWGFVMQIAGTEIAKSHSIACTEMCAACASIACILTLFIKEDLRKLAYSKAEIMEVDVAERLSKMDMLSIRPEDIDIGEKLTFEDR